MYANIFFIVSLVLFSLSRASAQDLSLTELTETVIRHSPALKGVRADTSAATHALSATRARDLPYLSASSQFTRSDQPVYVFGSLLGQGRFTAQNFAISSLNNPTYLNNVRSSLDLTWPLFTAFEGSTAKASGKLGLKQAQVRETWAAQQVRFQAIHAFLNALLQRELRKKLDERLTTARRMIAEADTLKNRGLVLGSDYYAARAILSGLEARYAGIERAEMAARQTLGILSGQDAVSPLLSGSLSDTDIPVPPLEQCIDQALISRPDLEEARLENSRGALARKKENNSLLPQLTAFGTLETNTNDFDSNPASRLVGVRADLPIGDPSYAARRRRAQSQEDASRTQVSVLEEQIRLDVTQSWQALEGVRRSLPAARDARDNAQKSLELFRPLYRQGRQSVLEVLRAEENNFRAESAMLETLFQLHRGSAQLALAQGRMLPETVSALEQALNKTP